MDTSTLRQAGREVVVLDRAVYEAVHATPSPTLDHGVALVSRAADRSKIWLSIAAVMAVAGERPRKAALVGLVAVGVTSALVNVGVKPLVRRERPSTLKTVRTHVVRMPTSASYPSGHTASAFAFSTAVGGGMPELDTPSASRRRRWPTPECTPVCALPGRRCRGCRDRGRHRVACAPSGTSGRVRPSLSLGP